MSGKTLEEVLQEEAESELRMSQSSQESIPSGLSSPTEKDMEVSWHDQAVRIYWK